MTGEPLAIGRAHHEGSLTPGKVHRSHGCLYLPYGGAEQSTLYYEVLVCEQKCEYGGELDFWTGYGLVDRKKTENL